MKVRRMGLVILFCLVAVWPNQPQAQGGGQAATPPPTGAAAVTGPGGSFGTFAPYVPDAAHPIGWLVRATLNNPKGITNSAKQKLLDGKQINGWTESRSDPEEYCTMAQHYDFIWIEMQHSRMTFPDVERMIAACPKTGVPIIRVPDAVEGNIQKATDLGAMGIIVPEVNDGFKAREAGKFTHVPPLGERSGGGSEAGRQAYNDNMLTIVMIETPAGVFHAYEIASALGVDVVITGNSDLSGSSKFALTDPRYQDLILNVHDAVLRAGKFFGTANGNYRTGTPISKDDQFMQSGPSIDGFVPPARGAAPVAAPAPAGAPPAPARGRQGGAPPAPPAR
jgi:2-keto-3-deoxy-L-rhamnonate aldolase RhmA